LNVVIYLKARQDGSFSLWSSNGPHHRPAFVCIRLLTVKFQNIEDAHSVGTETSRIAFSNDNFTLVTRGGDDTVKSNVDITRHSN
jgi:hypothetical protein